MVIKMTFWSVFCAVSHCPKSTEINIAKCFIVLFFLWWRGPFWTPRTGLCFGHWCKPIPLGAGPWPTASMAYTQKTGPDPLLQPPWNLTDAIVTGAKLTGYGHGHMGLIP